MSADQWAALLWLGCWLVALSVVDLRTRRLPDSMVLATLVGLVVIDTASAALALAGCAVQAVVLCRRPPPLAFGPWLGAGTLLVLVFT